MWHVFVGQHKRCLHGACVSWRAHNDVLGTHSIAARGMGGARKGGGGVLLLAQRARSGGRVGTELRPQ